MFKVFKMPALIVFVFGSVLSCVAKCDDVKPVSASHQQKRNQTASPEFKGVIKPDIRNSTPDWKPFGHKKAPADAPNFLFVLFDDTGLAAWSPYGGGINMPTLDKIAANGLTYTN